VKRARWLAPVVLVVALALTACGSKDNGGVITPSGDTSSTVTTP
jgi:hypothetical protein